MLLLDVARWSFLISLKIKASRSYLKITTSLMSLDLLKAIRLKKVSTSSSFDKLNLTFNLFLNSNDWQ
jgi:hypothetical protein